MTYRQAPGGQSGIEVLELRPVESAETTAFRAGDRILAIEGFDFDFANDLEMVLAMDVLKAERTYHFRVERSGQILEMDILGRPLSRDQLAELRQWAVGTEERLLEGGSFCLDRGANVSKLDSQETSSAFNELLRRVRQLKAGKADVRVERTAEGLELYSMEPQLPLAGFVLADLDLYYSRLAGRLKPGDGFIIRFAVSDGMVRIEALDVPIYIDLERPTHS